MSVIVLVGNKGGVGKTTLSLNLAAAFARNEPTVILDADPQGSASQWYANSEYEELLPPVFAIAADLDAQVVDLRTRYRRIIIDCPPSVLAPQTHAALRVGDFALIPVQPSPLDLWAMVHLERALEQARDVNPGLEALLVISQLEARTTLSRLMPDALAELDIAVAATAIRRRAVYRASALEGRSVFHMGRRGAAAAAELDQLISEVITHDR